MKKKGGKFIPKGVNYIIQKIEKVIPEKNTVVLENETLNSDILIIATGTKIAPEETEGMQGPEWHKSILIFIRLKVPKPCETSCVSGKEENWLSILLKCL